MESWIPPLEAGHPDIAWDLLLGRYRRLIFSAIRHYAQDYDDVMDVFARVCEALREDDLRGVARGMDRDPPPRGVDVDSHVGDEVALLTARTDHVRARAARLGA